MIAICMRATVPVVTSHVKTNLLAVDFDLLEYLESNHCCIHACTLATAAAADERSEST